MSAQILTIIVSVLTLAISTWKWFARKNREKRKQAEQARKDLDDANKSDDPSSFLDAFGRMR